MTIYSLRVSLVAALALGPAVLPARAAPPTLTYLFPAGARQGTNVEVNAGGTFERWPVGAWCDRPGVEVKAAKEKGRLTVHVAADVAPGTCWVRLYDEQGASALRPFLVGTLPEAAEQEPNDDPKMPQSLPSSCVVNGRLGKAGDVDGFAVKLAKGQTLVAALEANRTLGSPMDAVLQVVSPAGFVAGQNHDDRGLDPFLAFTAPADGPYVVRAFAFPGQPDSSVRFSGGDAFVYRLTLTTGGFADHAFPPAVARDKPLPVELVGWNIPAAAKAVAVSPGASTVWHPAVANVAAVRVEPHAVVAEAEPDGRDRPRMIPLPATAGGRIDRPGDVDIFEFTLKKGQKVVVTAEARDLGSPLDPLLRVTDAAGKALAQVDPPAGGRGRRAARNPERDPEVSFAAPQDGVYRAEVRDLYGDGSFRHVYRLRAVFPEPDYALALAADTVLVTPDKPRDVAVTVERRNGFAGEIEVGVEGLPAGVTAPPVKAKAGDGSVTLRVTGTGAASGAVRVVGRVAGRPDLARTATAPAAGFPATTHVWLTATAPNKKM